MPTYKSLSSANKELLPVANKMADEVICLPIYDGLEKTTIDFIVEIIKQFQ